RGAIVRFTTLRPPAVTTNPLAITTSAFTFSATGNPNASPTSAWFQYPATAGTSDGPPVVQVTPAQNIGAGSAPLAVPTVIAPSPFTTYVVTATASNAGGTASGIAVRFTTGGPPQLAATSGTIGFCNTFCVRMGTIVTLAGTPTEAWFEESLSPTFNSFRTTARRPVGAGFTSLTLLDSLPVSGSDTLVFIRAAAATAFGTIRSPGVPATLPVIGMPRP